MELSWSHQLECGKRCSSHIFNRQGPSNSLRRDLAPGRKEGPRTRAGCSPALGAHLRDWGGVSAVLMLNVDVMRLRIGEFDCSHQELGAGYDQDEVGDVYIVRKRPASSHGTEEVEIKQTLCLDSSSPRSMLWTASQIVCSTSLARTPFSRRCMTSRTCGRLVEGGFRLP